MGILEKLRPQPRWKHADPAVRAASVFDLGPDEADAVRALAREDAEPRVRRAAVTRLDDVGLLEEIARTDPDEEVRQEAVRGLAGLAAESRDPARAGEAVRALVGLGRTKELVVAARANADPAVRRVIVERIDDQKALAAISRHAPDGATRLHALSRVSDAAELAGVALKSEHTDSAVAALERLAAPDGLAAVAHHARNRVAARRARTRLRSLEEAQRPPEAAAAMSPDDRARTDALLARAESLVASADPDAAATRLAELRMAWAELQADVDLREADTRRFEAAAEAAREAIAERRAERAAEEAHARAVALEQAERLAIIEAIEGLDGPEARDRVAELRVRWDTLPAMPSEYAGSLTRRFQDTCRAFEDRDRRRVLAEAAAARLETLAGEAEQLAAAPQPAQETLARWRGLRRDADLLREHAAANPPAAERLERAVAALEEMEQRELEARRRREQDTLRRLQQLCRQVETLAADPALTLRAADRALRDVRAALEQRTPLPSRQDRQEIQARLEECRRALVPRVQELRDADDWQRWANLQVQEELCRAMEALAQEDDLEAASRRMRDLQSRWRQVALAPRVQGEAMWRRFRAAQEAVHARTAPFVAAMEEQRAANLARKQALVHRAEALAESSDWVRTATEIQGLQAEWKTIGAVSRGHERAVWERFRAASDRFFTRRQEDLKRRRDAWAANLARKEALCAQAEALADATDWERTAAEFRRLQTEWKTIGPVRKSKSEAIWLRFRAACDRFFDRYKHRDQVELQAKAAAREAVIAELDTLLTSRRAGSEAPDGLYHTLQEAQRRWQKAPELPRQLQMDLAARYHQALGRIVGTWPAALAGTDLDPEATRRRMERLVARVEELAESVARPWARLSPSEQLAQQWRERLAANTMGESRAEDAEQARRRAAEQDVRQAQAQWMRLGPVPPEVAGPLNERFQRACRRFHEGHRRSQPPAAHRGDRRSIAANPPPRETR
jgi:hypothetical protein